MYLSILALPSIGALVAGLRGRALGITGTQVLTIGCMVVATAFALVAFHEVALCGSSVTVDLGTWLTVVGLSVSWSLLFDGITVSMLLPVLVVSLCVHVYSVSYMDSDPHQQRFSAYLSMFTAFMVLLVTAESYLLMFVGWEGIGISSFLLIGFWTTRAQAAKSAVLALTVNRVGDLTLTVAFLAMVWVFGSLDYATILSTASLMDPTVLTVTGLLLLGGAMAKSAQLPLHTWLPAAMEGPTPVSALIHAATLVTAGVYLLLRSSPLLEQAPIALTVIAWTGALTTLYGAATGLVQSDLKRVIAFSTCSQVGLMIMAVGLSQYAPSLFHLVQHAALKALLFLSAGSVIHACADQQDLRHLGGLLGQMPFTYSALLVGSLSLIATPFLSGHYSKDAILETAAGAFTLSGTGGFILGTLGATLTAFYSVRLLAMTFLTGPNGPKVQYTGSHEAPLMLGMPLVLLAGISITGGYLGRDLFLGMGTDGLSHALWVQPLANTLVDADFGLPQLVKLLPFLGTLAGALTATVLYLLMPKTVLSLTDTGSTAYRFLMGKWQWDAVVTNLFIGPGLTAGSVLSVSVDGGFVELVGPHGLTGLLPSTAAAVGRTGDSALVTTQALVMLVGLLAFMVAASGSHWGGTIVLFGTLAVLLMTDRR